MAPRPCLACGVLIPSGSYCRRHRPDRDRLRGYAWSDLRQQVLDAHGHRCARCDATDKPLEIDHIDGDRTNNALSNLRPLCGDRCHRAKHRGDSRAR